MIEKYLHEGINKKNTKYSQIRKSHCPIYTLRSGIKNVYYFPEALKVHPIV